jgi:hypothetical protein
VKVAICSTVASANARRTTADPRRSRNVRPVTPAPVQTQSALRSVAANESRQVLIAKS